MSTFIGFHDGVYDVHGFIADETIDEMGTYLISADEHGGRFFGVYGRWHGTSRNTKRQKFYLLMSSVAFLAHSDEEVTP